tara:strand:+ start:104 stop:877 length:774 start_codon:yes stop_codon:yes gene_type:complete
MKNKLTLNENELISLIEKVARETKKDKITEQGRKLRKQIRKTEKLQKKQDEDFFEGITDEVILLDLFKQPKKLIDSVDYTKYPNLRELTELTLLTQTVEMATTIFMVNAFYAAGKSCEQRMENWASKYNQLEALLRGPLGKVYSAMNDMADFGMAGSGYEKIVNRFVNKSVKLINMLNNHPTAIEDFAQANEEGVEELWDNSTNLKTNISEKTFDAVGTAIFDGLECPPPVDIGVDDGTWLSRLFKGKKKKKTFTID